MDPAERLARLDEADRAGVVVLYLPGHVALYLGCDAGRADGDSTRSAAGARRARTVPHVIRRVVVSGLDLGAGTREGSLLQRVQTLAVFGKPSGPR